MKNSKDEKNKEDLIIENSKSILSKMTSDGSDAHLIDEYDKILKNYIKLNKQFIRMMKLGDSSSRFTLEKNKKVVSIARNKILTNYTEQRKLKEELSIGNSEDKKKILGLSKLLKVSMSKVELLEEEIKRLKSDSTSV